MSSVAAGDICFCKDEGQIRNNLNGACGESSPCKNSENGEVVQCCGAQSSCGSDGFCFFFGSITNNITGFYMGGCTDPSFTDPACQNHCIDFATQDVTYVPSIQKWACCSSDSGDDNCGTPGGETFDAPAPYQLTWSNATDASVTAGGGSAASSGAATSTGGAGAAAATSPAPSDAAVSQQSTGTPASTIALAAVLSVLVVAVAGLGFFLWWSRRKSRSKLPPADENYMRQYQPGTEMRGPAGYGPGVFPHPKPHGMWPGPSELDTERRLPELPNSPGR